MSGSGKQPVTAAVITHALRQTRRDIATAPDEKILQVLGMLDRLDDRGEADALIAPARPRLKILRPPHRLRLPRLLFMPADPMICDPAAAEAGQLLIPRNAIMPISNLVQTAMGPAADGLIAEIEHATSADAPLIARVGAEFWPEASAILATAAMPGSWRAAGLSAASFATVQAGFSHILACAPMLMNPAAQEEPMLHALDGAMADPQAFGMLLTASILRHPSAEAPLRAISIARKRSPALQEAVRSAISSAISQISRRIAGAAMLGISPESAASLRNDILLIERFEADPASARNSAGLRQSLRTACAQQFNQSVTTSLAGPLSQIATQGSASQDELDAMEGAARNLRSFEIEARRLGGVDAWSRQLAGLAASTLGNHALSPVERARLIEILEGPDAAAASLNKRS